MTLGMAIKRKAALGRPREKNIQETYRGLSYVVTTFRLSKQAYAELEAIKDAKQLGSRTNALQYAVRQVFEGLLKHPGFMSRAALLKHVGRTLEELGE